MMEFCDLITSTTGSNRSVGDYESDSDDIDIVSDSKVKHVKDNLDSAQCLINTRVKHDGDRTFYIDNILKKGRNDNITGHSVRADQYDEQSVSSTSTVSDMCILSYSDRSDKHNVNWIELQRHTSTSSQDNNTGSKRIRRFGPERKPRQAYSTKQLERLEAEFKQDKYLSVSKRMELSQLLGLTEIQIKTWFQNRRTKWKKQLTSRLKIAQRQGYFPIHLFSTNNSNSSYTNVFAPFSYSAPFF